jgi:hypothetical protein
MTGVVNPYQAYMRPNAKSCGLALAPQDQALQQQQQNLTPQQLELQQKQLQLQQMQQAMQEQQRTLEKQQAILAQEMRLQQMAAGMGVVGNGIPQLIGSSAKASPPLGPLPMQGMQVQGAPLLGGGMQMQPNGVLMPSGGFDSGPTGSDYRSRRRSSRSRSRSRRRGKRAGGLFAASAEQSLKRLDDMKSTKL